MIRAQLAPGIHMLCNDIGSTPSSVASLQTDDLLLPEAGRQTEL